MYANEPIEPMLATVIDHLPAPTELRGGCRYEPKWNGFRVIARVDKRRGVHLLSGHGTRLNEAFPERVSALHDDMPAATVIDGEIIRWGAGGRLDPAALRHRLVADRRIPHLARTQRCHLIVFDVLIIAGEDLTRRPFAHRRRVLEELLGSVPAGSPLVATMQTGDVDEARIWMGALSAQGIDGLVVKAAGDPYLPGHRRWLKYQARDATEMIIGAVTGSLDRPRELILGRREPVTGRLRMVGWTTPVPAAAQAELAAMLTPAGDDHPWADGLPNGWPGGLYGCPPPMRYVRVRPDVVIDISTDVAMRDGRFRHPARYLRVRPDLCPVQVPAYGDHY